MTTIRSLSLRIFPGRTRSTYAVTWRTQRGTDTTDRRLYWGDVPVGYGDLDALEPHQLIALVSAALTAKATGSPLPEGAGSPGGRWGAAPGLDQRLPGVDPDD